MKPNRIAAALLTAASLPAAAALDEANFSDLWWNPSESGWGAGIQRQGDVIFLTLFVYGADGSSTWFVAPNVQLQGGASWRGPLYRANGPAFEARYDASVEATETGSASIEFDSAASGTLRYTVNGVAVTKRIERMTWREPSVAGTYHGGFSTFVPECIDETRKGEYDFLGAMTATQAGRDVAFTIRSGVTGIPSTCTMSGTATYKGRYAEWNGTFNCTIIIGLDGRGENVASTLRRGTWKVEQATITSSGFSGVLTASDQDCGFTGYFGGTRVAQ